MITTPVRSASKPSGIFLHGISAMLLSICLLFCAWTLCSAESSYAASGFVPSEGESLSYSGTHGTCTWEYYSGGNLVIRPTEGSEGVWPELSNGSPPWLISGNVTNLSWIDTGIMMENTRVIWIEGAIIAQGSQEGLFRSLEGLNTIVGLPNLDTSAVTSIAKMFDYDKNLRSVDLSGLQTQNVTDMSLMFYQCYQLTSDQCNVLKFNTQKVTNMQFMFGHCKNLTRLDISNFDTSHVKSTLGMFYGCESLTELALGDPDTSSVEDMSSMFAECMSLQNLSAQYLETGSVTKMSGMFRMCSSLTSLDVSHFNTSKVTSMSAMFGNCGSLTSLNVTGFDTSKVTDMSEMFFQCRGLTELDVSRFDTSSVTSMSETFCGLSGPTSLDVSGFDTSMVTTMYKMFDGCRNLTVLDVSDFDTSRVTDMYCMFNSCRNLQTLDISHFNTSNVTRLDQMFEGLSSVTTLNLRNFKTGSATNMAWMFRGCSHLTSLDLSGFNTSKVTDMTHMFSDCTRLTELDLSGFDTSKVTDMYRMFYNCSGLKRLKVNFSYRGIDEAAENNAEVSREECLPDFPVTMYALDDTDYTTPFSGAIPEGPGTFVASPFTPLDDKTNPASISASQLGKNYPYTGSLIKPAFTVTLGGKTLKKGTDYTITFKNNKTPGKATVTIKGIGSYCGSISYTFKIVKAAQPMTVKKLTKSVKYSKVRKKAQTTARPLTIKKKQGSLSFIKVSKGSSKKLSVDKKTGKVKVKKGTKKGTYKIKIKITAKGNSCYKSGSKTVTVTIKVK